MNKHEFEFRCMKDFKGRPCNKLLFLYNGNIDKVDMSIKCPRCRHVHIITKK